MIHHVARPLLAVPALRPREHHQQERKRQRRPSCENHQYPLPYKNPTVVNVCWFSTFFFRRNRRAYGEANSGANGSGEVSCLSLTAVEAIIYHTYFDTNTFRLPCTCSKLGRAYMTHSSRHISGVIHVQHAQRAHRQFLDLDYFPHLCLRKRFALQNIYPGRTSLERSLRAKQGQPQGLPSPQQPLAWWSWRA